MKTVYVYGLYEGFSNVAFYIGVTVSPKARLNAHKAAADGRRQDSLTGCGVKAEDISMRILATCDDRGNAETIEKALQKSLDIDVVDTSKLMKKSPALHPAKPLAIVQSEKPNTVPPNTKEATIMKEKACATVTPLSQGRTWASSPPGEVLFKITRRQIDRSTCNDPRDCAIATALKALPWVFDATVSNNGDVLIVPKANKKVYHTYSATRGMVRMLQLFDFSGNDLKQFQPGAYSIKPKKANALVVKEETLVNAIRVAMAAGTVVTDIGLAPITCDKYRYHKPTLAKTLKDWTAAVKDGTAYPKPPKPDKPRTSPQSRNSDAILIGAEGTTGQIVPRKGMWYVKGQKPESANSYLTRDKFDMHGGKSVTWVYAGTRKSTRLPV